MRKRKGIEVTVAWLALAALALAAGPALAQSTPPPKPRELPGTGAPSTPTPAPRPRLGPPPPPPPPPAPVLVVTADMDCTIELDGEVIGSVQKDVVQEFTVRPGEHLLQAFPADIEGPTWKETIKAPDTGRVVAVVELVDVVAEWRESQLNLDRFTVGEASIVDNDNALVWTKNVSREMRWDEATGYCQQQRVDGAGGWRLPILDELSALYDPDNPEPRQETARPEVHVTIFGKRRGETEIQPRMIFEPFDHNSVSALWVGGGDERLLCTFLGEFSCTTGRKKEIASVFCVRPVS